MGGTITLTTSGGWGNPLSVVIDAGSVTVAGQTVTASIPGDWQLDAGHFVSAKMTPEIVGPSADTAAGTDAAWSRYRRAPSAIAYRVPIAVLGGAWPFRYQVDATSAGKGIAVGEVYGDTDYGVLTWASPTVGTHTITVTVTDQDSNTATRTWDLEVIARTDTAYFLFCDSVSGSDSTGDGSYGNPWASFLGWYGTTPGATTGISSTTHPGKQVFYRAGTYATNDITDPSGIKFWLNPTRKPQVHVAYPGEAVLFDCTDYYFGGMQDDFCVSGIEFQNAGNTESGWRITYVRNDNGPNRNIYFECEFGVGTGTADSGSNSGAIMLDGQEAYNVIVGNTFETTTAILVYGAAYSVFENNAFNPGASYVGNGIFLKSSGYDHWSIRNNRGSGPQRLVTCQDGLQSESDHTIHHIEICWNSYRHTTPAAALGFQESSGVEGGSFWAYRNSLHGSGSIAHNMFNAASSSPVMVYEKNVLQGMTLAADASASPQVFDTSNDSPSQTNVTGWLNSTTNLLEGDGLAYLGTHGAEVV